ncbi:hypothetical protein OB955_09675 [Halobacteria archaeon AArc-m2/3/4]|uniref:CHAT domain-containing protein n=1 Tax=Natronoglomus mannanivorans TaxID=2979990 RepID=A0AAP2YVQ5_9EURY|nr:hypothetical protein [Halobacteria archaeon AArc-xg1-1]MCU4973010.1 hypothetical protein [Halobacteria archaeon AArc-m2/3/4]
MAIEFDGTADPTGLEMYDPIEQRRLHVRTPMPVSPESVTDDQFCFPVDTACSVETDSLVFDQRYFVDIHDESGQSNRSLEAGETATLEGETQFIGLSGPIRVYCRVTAPGRIETGINSIHITFDEATSVAIGARSLHEQPAATIRAPDDPEAMMHAVSAMSSALKTTSPERAWPSLRGHPPLIERGTDLEIPSTLERPETDIAIEIPPTYRNLYTVSPLAFYLGAEIRSGTEPTIVTDLATYDLGVETRLEDDVARTLKHIFLLDCLVRTEGLYRDDLHERAALEEELPFNLWETYHAPLSEQLERYLSVPFDLVEPHVPRWPLTAHVPSTPDGIELLPFIVNELGIVREPRGERLETDASPQQLSSESGAAQFVRSAEVHRSPVFTPGDDDELNFVEPAVSDESIEHAWFGTQVPRGASKATIEAYQNQLSRRARNESIEILLICNDARMIEEHDVLDEAYGTRETLPFDVRSEFGVSAEQLTSLLTEGGYDFLHYIGHATPDGLECSDGHLDVRSLSSIDLGVFFLNACQSYEQGLAMAQRGAFGGVGTLGDIVNEHAVEIGETMARLLNLGFPLRAALELARETTILGDQYLIVGDGSADIAQSDGGSPTALTIDKMRDGHELVLRSYPTKEFRVGSVNNPNIQTSTNFHLTPGETAISEVDDAELNDYLTWTKGPVINQGTIKWNDGFKPTDLF